MRWLLWFLVLPGCLAALALVVARVVRPLLQSMRAEQARDQFRRQREWLEARFLDALGRHDPVERLRWEEAQWQDQIVWARDRQSGALLALVGVDFDPDPFDDLPDHPARYATVVFEYARGRWRTEGKHLDEVRPHEAFLCNRRFEPFSLPERRA